jgi:hypothetical protein
MGGCILMAVTEADIKQAHLSRGNDNFMKVLRDAKEHDINSVMASLAAENSLEVAKFVAFKLSIVFGTVMDKYLTAIQGGFSKHPTQFVNGYILVYKNIFNSVTGAEQQQKVADGLIDFFSAHCSEIQTYIRLKQTNEPRKFPIDTMSFIHSLIPIMDKTMETKPNQTSAVFLAIMKGIQGQLNFSPTFKMSMYNTTTILKMMSLFPMQIINQITNLDNFMSKSLKDVVYLAKNAKTAPIQELSFYFYQLRIFYGVYGNNPASVSLMRSHIIDLIDIVNTCFLANHYPTDPATQNRFYIGLNFLTKQIDGQLPPSVSDYLKNNTPKCQNTKSSVFENDVLDHIKGEIELFNQSHQRNGIEAKLQENSFINGFQLDGLVVIRMGTKEVKINVEVDGEQYHSGKKAEIKNSARDQDLAIDHDLTVVRLSDKTSRINYNDFREELQKAVTTLTHGTESVYRPTQSASSSRGPTPSPTHFVK